MADYIEREAAKVAIRFKFKTVEERTEINEVLNAIPAADVRPVVRGEWKDMGDFESCSACGATHLKEIDTVYGKEIWLRSNYCPSCGAKMKGE